MTDSPPADRRRGEPHRDRPLVAVFAGAAAHLGHRARPAGRVPAGLDRTVPVRCSTPGSASTALGGEHADPGGDGARRRQHRVRDRWLVGCGSPLSGRCSSSPTGSRRHGLLAQLGRARSARCGHRGGSACCSAGLDRGGTSVERAGRISRRRVLAGALGLVGRRLLRRRRLREPVSRDQTARLLAQRRRRCRSGSPPTFVVPSGEDRRRRGPRAARAYEIVQRRPRGDPARPAHRDLGYDGLFPGPTIVARRGERVDRHPPQRAAGADRGAPARRPHAGRAATATRPTCCCRRPT